jgi:hypothetical protein
VALKPGHSLMDWVRLGHSGVDLTGVGGVLQDVTLEQLAAHGKRNDAWIAIRGKIFAHSRPTSSDVLVVDLCTNLQHVRNGPTYIHDTTLHAHLQQAQCLKCRYTC